METQGEHGTAAVAEPGDPPGAGARGAYVGPGVTFRGRLVHEAIVRGDGTMEGEIETEGTVLIGDGALVRASVRAGVVRCAGTIIGDVVAGDRVELSATAVVDGSLNSPLLLLEEGAQANGRLAVGVGA